MHDADKCSSLKIAGRVPRGLQGTFETLAAFRQLAVLEPEPPQRRGEGQHLAVASRVGEARVNRRPEIVVFQLQPIEPGDLVPASPRVCLIFRMAAWLYRAASNHLIGDLRQSAGRLRLLERSADTPRSAATRRSPHVLPAKWRTTCCACCSCAATTLCLGNRGSSSR